MRWLDWRKGFERRCWNRSMALSTRQQRNKGANDWDGAAGGLGTISVKLEQQAEATKRPSAAEPGRAATKRKQGKPRNTLKGHFCTRTDNLPRLRKLSRHDSLRTSWDITVRKESGRNRGRLAAACLDVL